MKKKILIITSIVCVLILSLLYFTWLYLSDPDVLKEYCLQVLRDNLPPEIAESIQIGSIEITADNTITVKTIKLDYKQHTPIEIPEVIIGFKNLWKFKVDSIKIISPQIHIARDEAGQLNLPHFLGIFEGKQTESKIKIPEIIVENGKFIYQDEKIFTSKSHVELDKINIHLDPQKKSLYQLNIDIPYEITATDIRGFLNINGVINDEAFDFKMSPISLDLSQLHKAILLWPKDLETMGTFNIKNIKLTKGETLDLMADVLWQNGQVSYSLPYDRSLAIKNIGVTAKLHNENLTNISLDCNVLGQKLILKNGHLNQSSFYLPLEVPELVLSQDFVKKIDEVVPVPKHERFTPRGIGRISLNLTKEEQQNFHWKSEILLEDVSCHYHNKTVGLQNLNAHLEIDQEKIQIVEAGWKFSEGDFSISPNSQIFWKKKRSKNFMMSFKGLNINSKTWEDFPEAEAIWKRAFPKGNLEGKVKFPEDLTKVPEAIIYLYDFELSYYEAPHDVGDITAKILVKEDRVEIHNLRGKAKGCGAAAKFEGTIWFQKQEGEVIFDIKIWAEKGIINESVYEIFNSCRHLDEWHTIVLDVWHILRLQNDVGKASAYVNVRCLPETSFKVKTYVKVDAYGVAVNCREFSYPVEDVTGSVIFDDDVTTIKDFTARRGNGELAISGLLKTSKKKLDLDLDVHGKNILLDNDLKYAIGEEYGKIWDDFAPQGNIDIGVNIKLAKKEDEQEVDWKAQVNLRDVKISYKDFPYPVKLVTGGIRVTPKSFEISGVRGENEATRIFVDGKISKQDVNLALQIREMALNQNFYNALPKSGAQLKEILQLQGNFDANIDFAGNAEDISWKSKVFFSDISGFYRAVPYPFHRISGELEISPGLVKIKKCRTYCLQDKLRLNLSGNFSEENFDLKMLAYNLQLDQHLKDSLPKNTQKLWDSFDFSGAISAKVIVSKEQEKITTKAAIYSNECSITYKDFPYPMTIPKSTKKAIVEYLNGVIKINGVNGFTVNKTPFFADGEVSITDDGKDDIIELNINLKNTIIDSHLNNCTSQHFPELINVLSPKGSIQNLGLYLLYDPTQEKPYVRYTVNIHNLQGKMKEGLSLQEMSGDFYVDGLYYDEKHRIEGKWSSGGIKLKFLELGNISSKIDFSNQTYLILDPIEASMYDGKLRGSIAFETTQKRFIGDFKIVDGNLKKWSPLIEKDLAGQCFGSINFEGSLVDRKHLTAKGHVEIRDGHLWGLPIFLAMFDLFSLPSKPAFRDGSLRFSLAKEIMKVSSLKLHSSLLSITGKGKIHLDGVLDLILVTHFAPKIIPAIPFIEKVWNDIKKDFLAISVRGTFGDPSISFLRWQNIRDIMRDIMQGE